MDRLIYSALSGMRTQAQAQAVTAQNLANAAVPGFRRELSSVAAQWLGNSRAQADDVVRSVVAERGAVQVTGAPLDIAIDGAGWLAVQTADGAEAYTRRGDLRVSATGVLETGEGDAVLGATGPLTAPTGVALNIAPDGSLSAGGVAAGRLKLVTGDGLTKRPDGRFAAPEPLDADPAVRVTPGALEASNVSSSAMLVELLEQSRGFEASTRLLRMAREIDEGGTRLMRIDG